MATRAMDLVIVKRRDHKSYSTAAFDGDNVAALCIDAIGQTLAAIKTGEHFACAACAQPLAWQTPEAVAVMFPRGFHPFSVVAPKTACICGACVDRSDLEFSVRFALAAELSQPN